MTTITLADILAHNESIDNGGSGTITSELNYSLATEYTDGASDSDEMVESTIINPENEQKLIHNVWIPEDMQADVLIEIALATGTQYTDYSTGSIRRELEAGNQEEAKKIYNDIVSKYGQPHGYYELI